MPIKKNNSIEYPTEEVFAAASAAFRINEAYLKEDYALYEEDAAWHDRNINRIWVSAEKLSNKNLILRLLCNDNKFGRILDEDREHSINVRRHYIGLISKLITNTPLTTFEKMALKVANAETFNTSDLGIVAYLPSGYAQYVDRDTVEQRLSAARGYIALVGSRVKGNIEVLKSYFHKGWKVFFISGISNENKAVYFTYRENIEVGSRITISGRVKDTRKDKYEVTQLTRVRVH